MIEANDVVLEKPFGNSKEKIQAKTNSLNDSGQIQRQSILESAWDQIKRNNGGLDGAVYTLNQLMLVMGQVDLKISDNRQIFYKVIEKYTNNLSSQKKESVETLFFKINEIYFAEFLQKCPQAARLLLPSTLHFVAKSNVEAARLIFSDEYLSQRVSHDFKIFNARAFLAREHQYSLFLSDVALAESYVVSLLSIKNIRPNSNDAKLIELYKELQKLYVEKNKIIAEKVIDKKNLLVIPAEDNLNQEIDKKLSELQKIFANITLKSARGLNKYFDFTLEDATKEQCWQNFIDLHQMQRYKPLIAENHVEMFFKLAEQFSDSESKCHQILNYLCSNDKLSKLIPSIENDKACQIIVLNKSYLEKVTANPTNKFLKAAKLQADFNPNNRWFESWRIDDFLEELIRDFIDSEVPKGKFAQYADDIEGKVAFCWYIRNNEKIWDALINKYTTEGFIFKEVNQSKYHQLNSAFPIQNPVVQNHVLNNSPVVSVVKQVNNGIQSQHDPVEAVKVSVLNIQESEESIDTSAESVGTLDDDLQKSALENDLKTGFSENSRSDEQAQNSAVKLYLNEKALNFQNWYIPDICDYLLQMADNNAKCIRVVFPDSDEGNNTITFKTQLKELVELSNNLNRTALFISKEPGAKNHFICGLIENNNLLLINPLGISSHKIFYETLAELQREKTIKEIWLSSNSLQKIQYEEEGLVSCGPITLELAIHILTTFTPEELQLFWRDNLKTSQPTTHDASQLSYHGVNINNLLPNILKELGESNHEHVYQIKVCDIREKHFKQLQTLPAEHSKRLSISVENYLSKCKNEAPAQVIFNSLITDKTINNIDVSPEFQLLKNELELQAIDVNVLSHESNETLKLGKNLNPKDLRIEKNSEQIQQMSENRDGISKSKTKNIPEQQKPIPKKPDDNNMKEKDLGEGLYAITDEQKKIGSIYLESFKNGKMVKKDKKKLSPDIMLQLIDKDFDLNDKDTRDLFVALVKDKNVCKKKPSALIKLIEKKQPEITASVLKKCEGNSAFILTILNDANFKAEIAEQIKAAIDPVLQAEKDRKKLSDTAVVHIFNSGQFNEALVKYPDILAKLLFVNEAKELCAHLLINPDHLKWTEINLSKRQVEQFVKLGFESEVYSNYALVKKLKITDYSVCTELQLDAMLNNPQLFVKDEKIKEVLTNHIANNWLKNFDTKMDDFIKFLKIEKVRNAILTPLSSVQILKLCDDNNELLAALFSDRNKEGLIMKRFDELLPELTLDRIELANMVLEMPNVAQKLTLSQLFQLMTLGDKNITDWVYANKADIQFDSRQTKNLFDLNPFFAAKNISQDLIDIEDFFNLLLDNNKQEFVKNLLANDEPKLLEYIGNIYPNIKLLFESKKIFSWLDKYKPSGQQFVFQKNTSRDQSSIMLPRKDDKRKFKNILDSAEKNEINGNIRAAQDEYFAAYTHKKAGKEKLSSEKILATQKNPMTEYAPKDTRNKKDKKDKNQYASVVLGYKLVESCFLNKNYELLFQVLFQGEEVFKRNKKEKDIITRTNDVDASFLHYFKQIEANDAFIILSNQTFDQKLSSIYIDHIHQHFSTTRILESLSIDCLIGSDRLIFEKYVPDVNKKQKVLEAILSSESVNVFSVLKNDLDLLSWANSIMPKKVKNIISIALSDKSLSISYFLRSPVMTDIFETKEIVYYINENPATQKILPLYRHLSEVKVSFELEKRETERAAKQKLNEVELSLTPTQSPPEMKAQLDDNTPMKIGISPSRGGSRAPRAPRAPMAPNNQSEENKPAVKRELPKISAPESAIDDLISKMKKGKPLLKSQTNITGLDDEQVKHIKIASDAANNDVFRWRKFARELDGLINNKAIKTSEIFRTKLDGLLRDYNIVVEKDSDLDKVTQAILSAWNNKINISSSAAKITQSLYKYTDNTSVQNAGCNISTSPKDSSNTHKADEQKTPQQSGTYVTMDDAVSAALKRRRDIEGADDHNDDASQWDRSCGS